MYTIKIYLLYIINPQIHIVLGLTLYHKIFQNYDKSSNLAALLKYGAQNKVCTKYAVY